MTPPIPALPGDTWRDNIVGLTWEDPASMLGSPWNWRIHGQAQQAALREVLGLIGWITGVIQNDVTGHLIDGHDRVENAISTGQPAVPVLHVQLSEADEEIAISTFDTIALMAGRDRNQLLSAINDIRDRVGPALTSMLGSVIDADPWPQLGAPEPSRATNGRGGPTGLVVEASWTLGFDRGAADQVRAALGELRAQLGPDVNLTWVED